MSGLMGGGGGAAGGGFGARMQNIWQDPLFQMGMGVLGGNEGRTGDQAFRNSLRGGMQGVQAGQRNVAAIQQQQALTQWQKLREQQLAAEEERKRQWQAMAPQMVPALMSGDPEVKQQAITGIMGVDPSMAKKLLPSLMTATPPEQPGLSDVGSLRKEYTSVSKPWTGVRDAYEKLEASQPTAAGDISLIFSYMKMLDPASTVREGEAATVEQARGVPGQVIGTYNRIIHGQRLTQPQRAEFKNQAKSLMATGLRHQVTREMQYQGIAARAQMDPKDAIRDLIGPTYRRALGQPDTVPPPLPPGFVPSP